MENRNTATMHYVMQLDGQLLEILGEAFKKWWYLTACLMMLCILLFVTNLVVHALQYKALRKKRWHAEDGQRSITDKNTITSDQYSDSEQHSLSAVDETDGGGCKRGARKGHRKCRYLQASVNVNPLPPLTDAKRAQLVLATQPPLAPPPRRYVDHESIDTEWYNELMSLPKIESRGVSETHF